jgi:transposase
MPLNSFKRHETALRRAQQAMSRKVKFSSNWNKAKAHVQRIHARIGHARRDYLDKTTFRLAARANQATCDRCPQLRSRKENM